MHETTVMRKPATGNILRRQRSVTTGVIAVLLLITALLNQGIANTVPLLQARISDREAYLETKVLRISTSDMFLDLAGAMSKEKPEAAGPAQRLKDSYTAHLEKWREDVAAQEQEVREFEKQLSQTELRLRRLYLVEMLLGIALVVGSFATLTRLSWIGHVSLLLGLVGLVNLILAFL